MNNEQGMMNVEVGKLRLSDFTSSFVIPCSGACPPKHSEGGFDILFCYTPYSSVGYSKSLPWKREAVNDCLPYNIFEILIYQNE
jgi:hypothetical protein